MPFSAVLSGAGSAASGAVPRAATAVVEAGGVSPWTAAGKFCNTHFRRFLTHIFGFSCRGLLKVFEIVHKHSSEV